MWIGLGSQVKHRRHWKTFIKNKELLLLCLPALLYFFVFCYLPMIGIYMAFTDFRYADGVFGSKFVGLDNFIFFFAGDVKRITINTVAYGATFIVTGLVSSLLVALLLNELKSRLATKVYQTVMILPHFMSWVVVGLIVYVFLDPANGVVNHLLTALGKDEIMWYSDPKRWPGIIIFIQMWKNVGMSSVIYFAALMGIDPSYYEAATIDGAGKLAQIRYITIPSIMPLICIQSILAIGGLFRGDFGLFYQVPMDVGNLYPATDIIDTYIYRGLRDGNISVNTAVGLYQSLVGLVLVVGSNFIVNKINPDNSLF